MSVLPVFRNSSGHPIQKDGSGNWIVFKLYVFYAQKIEGLGFRE